MTTRLPHDNGSWLVLGGLGALAVAGMARSPGSRNAPPMTVAQVRKMNRSRGGSFFNKAVMDRFKSRIETPKLLPGGYFVTSEQFAASGGETYKRRYTLRKAKEDGAVETVGQYMEFASRKQAVNAARGLA